MSVSVTGTGPSITVDGSGSTIAVTVTTGGGSGGGVSDHGLLTGLSDDDHSQYHNDTRGDARYLQQSNDLSDVDDAATARTNLGLGSAATADADDFDVPPNFLIDAVEGASNPWDLDGLVGNGTIVLLTTVTTVTLPDAADLPAGTEMRFANGTAGALSLTVNCAGSDEFSDSATSINPTIPVVGTVVVTKMDTAIGFEWGWSFFGNVSGPASATDSAIALFDGIGGRALKDSAVTISTDDTLASDSDSLIPTEQAVKAYVDANAGGGGGLAPVLTDTSTMWGVPGGVRVEPPTANNLTSRITVAPFEVAADITITQAQLQVNSAASSGKECKIGIWDYAGDLVATVGTVLIDTTGTKSVTGLSIDLAAGYYWSGLLPEETAQFYCQRQNFASFQNVYNTHGTSNVIDLMYAAQAYGALPDPLPSLSVGSFGSDGWRHWVSYRWT